MFFNSATTTSQTKIVLFQIGIKDRNLDQICERFEGVLLILDTDHFLENNHTLERRSFHSVVVPHRACIFRALRTYIHYVSHAQEGRPYKICIF
jgi:hypothetical protein